MIVYSTLGSTGSSPLTRGKHLLSWQVGPSLRLIPAHAGKTRRRVAAHSGGAAHPRSRGENPLGLITTDGVTGSSPLTRGKHRGGRNPDYRKRLIPAHAGKTGLAGVSSTISAAHPRSRGENDLACPPVLAGAGSSPLTRGKHFLTCAFIAQIDQILESLELCASSESYSLRDAYATDVLQDQVRSIGLAPLSSRGAS